MVKKFGYKESRDTGDGNMVWYGLALRDADIDFLKNRVCMINRYPLMDVSLLHYYIILFVCSTLRKRTFSVSLYRDCSASTLKSTDLCLTVSCCPMKFKT